MIGSFNYMNDTLFNILAFLIGVTITLIFFWLGGTTLWPIHRCHDTASAFAMMIVVGVAAMAFANLFRT